MSDLAMVELCCCRDAIVRQLVRAIDREIDLRLSERSGTIQARTAAVIARLREAQAQLVDVTGGDDVAATVKHALAVLLEWSCSDDPTAGDDREGRALMLLARLGDDALRPMRKLQSLVHLARAYPAETIKRAGRITAALAA